MYHCVPPFSSTSTAYTKSPSPRTTRLSRAAMILAAPGRPAAPAQTGFALERAGANAGEERPRLPIPRQTPLPVGLVQNDHVAWIDPVGITDLVAVHAPHFGPAPRLLTKPRCKAPECVAF